MISKVEMVTNYYSYKCGFFSNDGSDKINILVKNIGCRVEDTSLKINYGSYNEEGRYDKICVAQKYTTK